MKKDEMRSKMENDINEIHERLGIQEIEDTSTEEIEDAAKKTAELSEEEKLQAIRYWQEKMKNVPKPMPVAEEVKMDEGLEMKIIDPDVHKEIKPELKEDPVHKKVEEEIEPEKVTIFEPTIPIVEETINEILEEEVEEDKKEEDDEFTFNIDEIEFVESPDGVTALNNFKESFDLKDTYQVICAQSRYVANMEAIKYGDALAITNSVASPYQERQKTYKMLYNKIESTSIDNGNKKISYDTFLKLTSFYDVDTLMFGIYQKSFPGTTEFTIDCKHCRKSSTVEIDNEKLIAVKNEEAYKDLKDILKRVSNPEQARKESILNKTTRKILKQSKVLVDIGIPSLYDHLNLIGSVTPEKLEENKTLLSLMLFIKKLYMLDREKTRQAGSPKYYEITSREEIANILENLPIRDSKDLAKVIKEKNDEVSIDYKVKSFPCPKCKEELGDIEIDIESLLFFNALQ